jgi:hypothetical protein
MIHLRCIENHESSQASRNLKFTAKQSNTLIESAELQSAYTIDLFMNSLESHSCDL